MTVVGGVTFRHLVTGMRTRCYFVSHVIHLGLRNKANYSEGDALTIRCGLSYGNLIPPCRACKLYAVKQVANLGVLLVVALLAGTPLIACMLPGGATTDEESACCREMGSECGHGSMPSSHSCCQRVSAPGQAALGKASFNLSVTLLYVGPPRLDFNHSLPDAFRTVASIGHSPPETPPASPEILRI